MREQQEGEAPFQPDFSKGLLPVIVQEKGSGLVLMLAWLNEEAWQASLRSGEAHYWSRSRGKLWRKGESSGNTQKISSIRLDCDYDAILFLVEQKGGAACHTGRQSCFFREWRDGRVELCSPKIFDPEEVYGKNSRVVEKLRNPFFESTEAGGQVSAIQ